MTHLFRTLLFSLPHMRNKTPLTQVIMHVICAAVALGIMMSVVSLMQRSIDKRVAFAREKLLLLRTVEDRQALFINLNNDYKRLTPLFPSIYSIIPRPEEVIAFADTFDAVAKETGNTIAFQFDTKEPSFDPALTGIGHVQFHAAIEGTGESFTLFLQRLHTLRYVNSINIITLEGAQGIYGAITAKIEGTVFVYRNDK